MHIIQLLIDPLLQRVLRPAINRRVELSDVMLTACDVIEQVAQVADEQHAFVVQTRRVALLAVAQARHQRVVALVQITCLALELIRLLLEVVRLLLRDGDVIR